MSYQAALFDMDGVLIDTRQEVTAYWLALAAQHGVQISDIEFEQHVYGCSAGHTFTTLFPHLSAAQLEDAYVRMAAHSASQTYTPVAGAFELVRGLRQAGVPIALVTGAEPNKVASVTRQIDLAGLFSTVITAQDIYHGKPDPECYLLAARRLGALPERCLVFEDALSGAQAALAAGTTCIGVQPSPRLAAALLAMGVRRVVPNLTAVTVESDGADSASAARFGLDGGGPGVWLAVGTREGR